MCMWPWWLRCDHDGWCQTILLALDIIDVCQKKRQFHVTVTVEMAKRDAFFWGEFLILCGLWGKTWRGHVTMMVEIFWRCDRHGWNACDQKSWNKELSTKYPQSYPHSYQQSFESYLSEQSYKLNINTCDRLGWNTCDRKSWKYPNWVDSVYNSIGVNNAI